MKTTVYSIAAVLVAALFASEAAAQCNFDIVKAKGIKSEWVRAYAACPSTEHPTVNTETDGDTDACTPVTPRQVDGDGTLYSFNDKGGCKGQTKAKLVKACEDLEDEDGVNLGLEPGPCHVTFVKGKCKGIVQNDGETPITSPTDDGWSFATLSRATLNDDTNQDMTVIDFPVTFLYGPPKKGKIKLKSNSAEALIPLVGPANAELPTCTSIELVDAVIKDPQGLPFARMGGATVP